MSATSDTNGSPDPPRIEPPLLSEEAPGEAESRAITDLAPPKVGWRRISARVYLALGALAGAAILGFFSTGELGAFFMAAWEVVLFAAMCVVAYVGLEARSARVLSKGMLGLLLGLSTAFNMAATFAALTGDSDSAPDGMAALLALVGCLTLAAASSAMLPSLARFRQLGTALTGNQEWTSVRLLALRAVVALTAVAIVPLGVLGEPPLLMMLQGVSDASAIFDDGRGSAGLYRDQLYSLCWTLLAAALAVGYGVQRNWPETLERLGLTRVSLRHFVVALVFTGLLLALGEGLDLGIAHVWQRFGWRTTDVAAVEALFGPLISPVGAVVVGVTAGLGEEVAVRGILQPRLGILISNLFFTSLHAYQYSWDGLLSVFVIGLSLGWIRKRTNTSVSAIVHGSYDFVLIMLEVF